MARWRSQISSKYLFHLHPQKYLDIQAKSAIATIEQNDRCHVTANAVSSLGSSLPEFRGCSFSVTGVKVVMMMLTQMVMRGVSVLSSVCLVTHVFSLVLRDIQHQMIHWRQLSSRKGGSILGFTMAGVFLTSPKWWCWSPLPQGLEDDRAPWSRTGEQGKHMYIIQWAPQKIKGNSVVRPMSLISCHYLL